MDSIYNALKPDIPRLLGLRKRFLLNPSACLDSQLHPVTSYSIFATFGDFALYIVENLLATELVAVLAISCAWLCHPQSELRLRAGLPPPPWMATWMMSFRVAHWICINAFCLTNGTETNFVSFRMAVAMWGTAVIVVGLVVAGFVARAMLRNVWEEWRYRWTAGRMGKYNLMYKPQGLPILKDEDVLPRGESSKLKRE